MGELHLEVYVERMKREYAAEVTTGNPRVAYRETITQRAEFNYTHRKQTGGSGQYGRVAGWIEPIADEDFVFENKVTGGSIPTQFIAACEKGFRACLAKGPKMEFPVTGVKIVINDGNSHTVDSSDIAFQQAARGRLPGGLRQGQARHPRARHEGRRGDAHRVPGPGHRAVESAPRHDRRRQDEGPCRSSRPMCPGGDVRFLDGPEILHAGQGTVHDGIAMYKLVPQSISRRSPRKWRRGRKTRPEKEHVPRSSSPLRGED